MNGIYTNSIDALTIIAFHILFLDNNNSIEKLFFFRV